MARRIYPRTIVEKAPSHNGKPCYAAWELIELDPDTQTLPDASNRPLWSIQIYDTTPRAVNGEHIRTMAQELEESTRRDRDGTGRGAPSRVEVHGLPLPATVPDEERAAQCMAHHRREIVTRNATGLTDFYIPPTFDDTWEHQIVIIHETEASLGETDGNAGAFLAVYFGFRSRIGDEISNGPIFHVVRFPGTELGDKLRAFTRSIGWFYDSYVADGTIYRDLQNKNEMEHDN